MSATPASPPLPDDAIVHTAFGPVRGTRSHTVTAFHAIPYAAPPVGTLRFAAPRDPERWTTPRDCTKPGPSAPQNASRLDAVMGLSQFSQSEDCLNLTVWTPAADGKKRPVFVWLHGGAYMSGGGDQAFYTGGRLAARGDVVVVSLTYRLGALGFLYVPGIDAEGGAPANRGFLDQIKALQWVKANIAAFGGDPDAITVSGQSAGGGALMGLLVNPVSAPLIRRAILQSSPGQSLTEAQARDVSALFFAKAGLQPGDIAGLRALEVPKMLAAQGAVMAEYATKSGRLLPFQLVAEQPEIPASPSARLSDGASPGIPLMLGWTKDEMHAWFAQDAAMVATTMLDDLARFPAANGLPDAIRAPVSALIAKGLAPWEALGEVMTVKMFGGVAQAIADSRAAKGCATYLYRFDWRPTRHARFGACHCIEIPFMFDNFEDWPASPMLEGADPASIRRVTDAVQAAWIAFIRTGNPGWPARAEAPRAVMAFDDETRLIDL